MSLNDVMALILRYFTEFVYYMYVVVKKFTFAISSPDEFLVRSSIPGTPFRCAKFEINSTPPGR